jgi:hypothetical protein
VTFSSKLLSALKNKDYHNLSLLRIDSELSCGDLVDGGALNIYAAQAIIDFLNFERLAKGNPSLSSVYACQGHSITIDQTIREGRILRGTLSVVGERAEVIVKLHHSDEDSRRGGPRGERVLKFTREWVSPEVYLSNRSPHLEPGAATDAGAMVLSAQKPMDVFPLGLMLACLFSRERSARMTMLPEDEAGFHVALTEAGPGPWSLSERISCDCFSVTDSCCESVRSLCVLDPVCRGSLSGALSGLEKLHSTELQKEIANLRDVNAAHGRIIEGIGEGMERIVGGIDRIEARVNDETPFNEMIEEVVIALSQAERK